MHGAHKLFGQGALQLFEQGIIVARGVEDNDWFEIESQLFPRDDFEQFFESAYSAGQCHTGVAQLGHLLFAAVHIGGHDEACHALVLPLLVYHKLWDDANGLAACLHTPFGRGGHKSRASCSVDERMAVRGKGLAEASGGFDKGGGGLSA